MCSPSSHEEKLANLAAEMQEKGVPKAESRRRSKERDIAKKYKRNRIRGSKWQNSVAS